MRKPQASEISTDGDLLRLSAKGDEDAFLILYRRHQGLVFRFALHMSGSRDIAEEVTQEVFLSMLADAHQYSVERGPLESYLIGMARNQVRRQLRCLRPLGHGALDINCAASIEAKDQVLNVLSTEQDLRALRDAILKLPANYREVIVLCDLEGMDYIQAAKQLGCAVGTVRSRLHRARGLLGAKLRSQDKLRTREGCPV